MNGDDSLHFATATGFVRLGDWNAAYGELERLNPETRTALPVLALKADIFRGMEKWGLFECVVRTLAYQWSDEPQWMVEWIVVKRRLAGNVTADGILADYLDAIGNAPQSMYGLGKYAYRIGDKETAMGFLHRAFELQPALRLTALDDPELDAIWE